MKLYIDNREPKAIIDSLEFINNSSKNKITIEIKSLDLGDFVLYDEINEQAIIIIERKSLADLEASIKDGRYNEQSYRLSQNTLANHNIYYLIEGSIINYKNKSFKNTLYSSLFSLSYFKGFSVFNSLNAVESAEIVYSFVNKFLREKDKVGYYSNNNSITNNEDLEKNEDLKLENKEDNYLANIKNSKKSNITRENIDILMLMQVPGVSITSATTIINTHKTINNLVNNLTKDETCLDSLKTENNNRKISKNIIASIKLYLLNKE
jgi:ERCC4-type nuclease